MAEALIHDRGRGPEIVGTRLTVYNLLPHFLDETATEAYLCRLYELTPEQVAAARAFVLNNAEAVLAQHLEIEKRMAVGNPPEVIEAAKRTRATFQSFKDFLSKRQQTAEEDNGSASQPAANREGAGRVPTFREWFAEREAQREKGA